MPYKYVKTVCASCGEEFMARKDAIFRATMVFGVMRCKPCATTESNKARAREDGSKRYSAKGYVEIKVNGIWRREHIVIAESAIGRSIRSDECVHHKNGIKDDNRPENLEVMLHGEHTRDHHTGSKRSDSAKASIRNSLWNKSSTKMTPELLAEVKRRFSSGETQRSISVSCGISPISISRAVRGLSWAQEKGIQNA